MLREQGLWYSGAFIITFIPPTIFTFWETYWTHLLCVVTFHLIGFTNAVIYIRPRFIRIRRDFPSLGCGPSLWYTLARKRPRPPTSAANTGNETTMISSAVTEPDVVLQQNQQQSVTSSLGPLPASPLGEEHSLEEFEDENGKESGCTSIEKDDRIGA